MDEQGFARVLAQALKEVGVGQLGYGTKAPATGPTFNWTHGATSMFGSTGLEPDVISARITPRGISQYLRAYPSVYTLPEYPYITGIEHTSGWAEPTAECATCPSGEMEACIQSAPFGWICRETKTLDPNRAIERLNRGDVDLRIVNDLIGPADIFQPINTWSRDTILQVATALGMLEIGALIQSRIIPMIWTGNYLFNPGPGYSEFFGLDYLIGTGKVDLHTNVTCKALDSDVKDFNYALVNSTDANGNFNIVRYLEQMEAYVYHNAARQNLLPATWAVVMRPELWYELTNIWPVAYLTTRNITLPATTSVTIDAGTMRDMRTQMEEGQFIYLNGRKHMVIVDDGVDELNPADNANILPGQYASSIYLVPLTYLGGRPATYFEYKDYRAAQPEAAAMSGHEQWWTEGDGKFMWTTEWIKWCYTISAKIEPRVVLRVPQLAGRLQHVRYEPLQHLRDFDENSSYFYKGGVSMRNPSTVYYPTDFYQHR